MEIRKFIRGAATIGASSILLPGLAEATTLHDYPSVRNLVLADFDADGITDVFHADGSDWWISWSGTSAFQDVNNSGFDMDAIAFGDFDGDGRTDVFRSTSDVWKVSDGATDSWRTLNSGWPAEWGLLRRESQSYGQHTTYQYVPQLAFADFNDDGKTDVFTTTYGGGPYWLASYGGTSNWYGIIRSGFELWETYPREQVLALADFDGDGRADVFRPDGSRWYVSWSGTESWERLGVSGMTCDVLAFADFNGDNEDDVFYGTGSRWWVSWSGTSSWDKTTLARSQFVAEDLAFGDFDGDGRADVFRTNGSRWKVSYGGTERWSTLNSISGTATEQLWR